MCVLETKPRPLATAASDLTHSQSHFSAPFICTFSFKNDFTYFEAGSHHADQTGLRPSHHLKAHRISAFMHLLSLFIQSNKVSCCLPLGLCLGVLCAPVVRIADILSLTDTGTLCKNQSKGWRNGSVGKGVCCQIR